MAAVSVLSAAIEIPTARLLKLAIEGLEAMAAPRVPSLYLPRPWVYAPRRAGAWTLRARSATGEEHGHYYRRDQQPINREHNVVARAHVANQESDRDKAEDRGRDETEAD